MARTIEKRIAALRTALAERLATTEDNPEVLELHTAIVHICWPDRNPTLGDEMVAAIEDVTALDPILNSGQCRKFCSQLLKAGYTPEQLRTFYDLKNPASPWCKDWRSGKGDRHMPSERDINQTIGGFAKMFFQKGGTTARNINEL